MKQRFVAYISILPFLLLQGCEEKLVTEIIQQATSPDGSLVATVFIKKGDATLPLMVDVHLGAKDDKIPAFGNVFRGNHSEKARVVWIDNQNLEIISEAEPFLLMKKFGNVSFELKPK